MSSIRCIDNTFHSQFLNAFDKFNGLRFFVLVIFTRSVIIMCVNYKLNVLTTYITDKLMRIVHVKAIDTIKNHIIDSTIYSCSCKCNQWEHVVVELPNLIDVITQEPVVNTEISSPCRNKMSFIYN
ncbi:hypothetical protein IMSAGC022_01394 [Alistipes sp.]|nr:hypothetical protein IMSAGC022_01394 [Alistipes sp.]